jgi:hypothetical protein
MVPGIRKHDPIDNDDIWDVSSADLQRLDLSLFDPAGIKLPDNLTTSDRAFYEIAGNEAIKDPQTVLFSESDDSSGPLGSREATALWALVAKAYVDIRCDRSIDFIVAEPSLNAQFVRRCWELGAAASPFMLNWLLLNARKAGRLSSLDLRPSNRAGISRHQLDEYSFAADIAMRAVQDRVYFCEQRDVSVDHVLCDPHLAREFDRLATEIIPDRTSFELRWAAISIRKARRTRVSQPISVGFEHLGLLEDVKLTSLPRTAGVYWIKAGNESIFVGVAKTIRNQVDSLLCRLGTRVLPKWMTERKMEKPSIAICTQPVRAAEIGQSFILQRYRSLLNYKQSAFFGDVA